jgi:hypothetical protein
VAAPCRWGAAIAYNAPVKYRIALAAGWGIALFALIGIARLPGNALDLYFKDTYVDPGLRPRVTASRYHAAPSGRTHRRRAIARPERLH